MWKSKSTTHKVLLELDSVKDTADEDNQYERRDTIIFSGSLIPPYEPNENCIEIL